MLETVNEDFIFFSKHWSLAVELDILQIIMLGYVVLVGADRDLNLTFMRGSSLLGLQYAETAKPLQFTETKPSVLNSYVACHTS